MHFLSSHNKKIRIPKAGKEMEAGYKSIRKDNSVNTWSGANLGAQEREQEPQAFRAQTEVWVPHLLSESGIDFHELQKSVGGSGVNVATGCL